MGLVKEADDPLIPSEPLVTVPPIAPKALPPPIEKKGSILKKRSVTSVSDIDHKNEAIGQKEISKRKVYSSHRFKSYES